LPLLLLLSLPSAFVPAERRLSFDFLGTRRLRGDAATSARGARGAAAKGAVRLMGSGYASMLSSIWGSEGSCVEGVAEMNRMAGMGCGGVAVVDEWLAPGWPLRERSALRGMFGEYRDVLRIEMSLYSLES
jgi:hypothetical protein